MRMYGDHCPASLPPTQPTNQALQFAQKKRPLASIFKGNSCSLTEFAFKHFFKDIFLDRKDALRGFYCVPLASRSRLPRAASKSAEIHTCPVKVALGLKFTMAAHLTPASLPSVPSGGSHLIGHPPPLPSHLPLLISPCPTPTPSRRGQLFAEMPLRPSSSLAARLSWISALGLFLGPALFRNSGKGQQRWRWRGGPRISRGCGLPARRVESQDTQSPPLKRWWWWCWW